MKIRKILPVLLLLLLLLSACGKETAQEPPQETPPAEQPETAQEAAPAEEPEEEPETPAEPEPESEPEPEAPDPAALQETMELYRALIGRLQPESWSDTYYALPADAANAEGADWSGITGVSALLIADLDEDGLPELLLQSGEVEQEMTVFTVRDGAVCATGSGMLDNQMGTCVLSLYRENDTGRRIAVSEGGAGTGAGNAYFCYYTDPETLSVHEAPFEAHDDFDEQGYFTVWTVDGEEVTEEEYQAARAAFYKAMTPEAILEFALLDTDPLSVLEAALDAFAAGT